MKSIDVGSLILRVFLGIFFAIHGFAKFQGGVGNTAAWFESINIPGLMAYVVTTIELVGGILLIIGLGTRYISALLFVIMIAATLIVKLPAGFMGNGQSAGYELDLAFAVIALFLFLKGNSPLSLDEKLFDKRDSTKESVS